jgi:type VI secretion system secreted protein VgrG
MPTSDLLPEIRYTFEIRDVAVEWHVRRVDLREVLSEPYHLALELVTTASELDPARLLGASCTLTLARDGGGARDVHGLVLGAEVQGRTAEHRHLRLDIGPALALLAHRVGTRCWQHTSVPEIVREVLEEPLTAAGRDFELDLAASYGPREYCVQYRESDLTFVRRLLQEAGISFTFAHEDGAERLVMFDQNARRPVLRDVPFVPEGGTVAAAESVERLDAGLAVGPTKLRQRDWNPLAAADGPRMTGGGFPDLARVLRDHDDRRFDSDDGGAFARLKFEQRAFHRDLSHGAGTVLGFAPGHRFDLEGHPDPARDRRWFLVRVEHHGDVPDAIRFGDEQVAPRYVQRFVCVDDARPVRPPLDPSLQRPRVHGPHTAIVVGPEGEEIHTDEHGRIRVRFHWDDRDEAPDRCSCWIRVAQTWAGPGWGGLFIPRVGMEVLVQFIDGDPDRPLVVGCVYNSLNLPPHALPDHKTRSGLVSESTPGGGHANQILLEDARGRESLTLRSRRDIHTHAGHDHTADIANDHTTKVGENQTTDVGGNQVTTVIGHRDVTVAEGDLTTTVDVGKRVDVTQGDHDTLVRTGSSRLTVLLGGHYTEVNRVLRLASLEGPAHLRCKEALDLESREANVNVHAHKDLEMNAFYGLIDIDALNSISLRSRAEGMSLVANTSFYAEAHTGDILLKAGQTATLSGDTAAAVLSKRILLQAEDSITLRVANTSIVLTPTGLEIKAPSISSGAIGEHTLTGAVIRLN